MSNSGGTSTGGTSFHHSTRLGVSPAAKSHHYYNSSALSIANGNSPAAKKFNASPHHHRDRSPERQQFHKSMLKTDSMKLLNQRYPSHLSASSPLASPTNHLQSTPLAEQDFSPHSAQLQLSIERSYMQQLTSDNRTLLDKLSLLENRMKQLKEHSHLTERSKAQCNIKLNAANNECLKLENRLKEMQKEREAQKKEMEHMKKLHKSVEKRSSNEACELREKVKELEGILEAMRMNQKRTQYKHEIDCEQLKTQVDLEKQKHVILSRNKIEMELDRSIHEKNESLLQEKDAIILSLEGKIKKLRAKNANLKHQSNTVNSSNKKLKGKLKRIEKKVIPPLKEEIERQSKYIELLQRQNSASEIAAESRGRTGRSIASRVGAGASSSSLVSGTARRDVHPFSQEEELVEKSKKRSFATEDSGLSLDSLMADMERSSSNLTKKAGNV